MKYLKVFETENLQNEFREGEDYLQPHVSCLEDGSKVKYNLYSKEDCEKLNVPFTIEATQDGTTIYFRQSSYAVNNGLDPLKVEVSTDNGETWEEITAARLVDVPGTVLVQLDEGEKVLIRGNNEAYGFYDGNEDASLENCNFFADSQCYIYGNIMSLVGGDTFASLRNVRDYAFAYFFSDYDGALDWSWVLSKEGEELLLPATTLASDCYFNMFSGCTALTVAPELPAVTLAHECYSGMFTNCTSLTSTPELPAMTLADGCYSGMFYNCVGLTTVSELPATTLATSCYSNMFSECINLTTAPELPAMTLANYCYTSMFSGCKGLTSAPELPATTLMKNCYHGMFYSCTSLITAPVLPATTLVNSCYNTMFFGCSNLTYIKAMFTTTPSNSYTST